MDSSMKQYIVSLKSKLHKINYPTKIKSEELASGKPQVYLPIINHILMDYSPDMARIIVDNGFDLYAKNDTGFMKNVYQLLLKLFNYKPAITVDQFFRDGYNGHKMILACHIIDAVNKQVKDMAKPKKKQHSTSTSFSKRSTSLKPRKLDMQHSNNDNLQILNDPKDSWKHRNPYANPFEEHNGLAKHGKINVNQSYCVPPKPPSNKSHKNLIKTHDSKLSLTKENISPNMALNPSEFLDTNGLNPSSQTYHVNPNRPGSARGPMFEFNSHLPQGNATQTKKMMKERNRKNRKSTNKSRTEHQHNVPPPPPQKHEQTDDDSIHSENTAIHLSQYEYENEPKPEVQAFPMNQGENMQNSGSQMHTPGFGQPEVSNTVVPHHQIQPNYVENTNPSAPAQPDMVSRSEFDKLSKQNHDLKQMISSLSESFSLLTKEYSKNMDAMKTTCSNLYSKHTLLENKVNYLER